jgi:hypothetical protein
MFGRMKMVCVLLAFSFFSLSVYSQSAGVTLVSTSVQIQPTSTVEPLTDLVWKLSFSSLDSPSNPNNEARLADADVPYSHQGFFVILDPTTEEPEWLPFVLNVPDQGDTNTNGVPDFFDVALSTDNLQTNGRHPTFGGNGADFTAKWQRAAGASTGTVVINLAYFGLTFVHQYAILSYEGTYTYSPAAPKLQGTVTMTNLVSSDDRISGPLSLTITNNNQLGYSPGSWTNATGSTYTFPSVDSLDRAGTHYIAFFEFADGFPETSDPDYLVWFLVLHSGDANGNEILDLVEGGGPVQNPRLDITKTAGGIELTITGTAGRAYILESAASLPGTSWSEVQSVSLGSNTQTVQLAAPGASMFFRLREAGVLASR